MGRILIVDDQIDSCRPLSVLVKYLGHKGDYATSGAAALDYLSKYRPDLLILDVMMPGMDGFEVLRRLRADPAHAHLPVVMFSALDEQAVQRHAMELGADDYWVKASMGFECLGERLEAFFKQKTGAEYRIPDEDGNSAGMANA